VSNYLNLHQSHTHVSCCLMSGLLSLHRNHFICYKETRDLLSQVQLSWKTPYLANIFQGGTVYNAVAVTESDSECTVVDRNRSWGGHTVANC